jgi:hypothetical protein
MKTHYILIDFENVQPDAIDFSPDAAVKVIVFVGEQQQKISLGLAVKLQKMGSNAEYIRISGSGQNALDFHIAYWAGRLAERDPKAYFHIVSKDKGFDPLLRHLKSMRILAQRVSRLSEIHIGPEKQLSLSDRVAEVIKSLKGRGNSRPRRIPTLKNTISAMYMKALPESEIDKIVGVLRSNNAIEVKGEVVTYNLAD